MKCYTGGVHNCPCICDDCVVYKTLIKSFKKDEQ